MITGGSDVGTLTSTHTTTQTYSENGSRTVSWSSGLSLTTTTDVVSESGYDTYSESMAGTETYGQGGTISGGSDSFTWAQTASDNLIITQAYGGTTMGAYTLYDMTIDDIMYENFSDAGTDTLGPSHSILAGCDTYTWGTERILVSTLTDHGEAATPYWINAYSSNRVDLSQTGSDTLTTDGHIYATVTYQYSEQTSDSSSVTQSVSGNGGWVRVGTATMAVAMSKPPSIPFAPPSTRRAELERTLFRVRVRWTRRLHHPDTGSAAKRSASSL